VKDEMTDEQLAELEKLEREATPGPWEVCEYVNDVSTFGKDSGRDKPATVRTIRTTWEHPQLKDKWPIVHEWFSPYLERKEYADIDKKDAELIVSARNALPALIAEIRTLRAEVKLRDERWAALRTWATDLRDNWRELKTQYEERGHILDANTAHGEIQWLSCLVEKMGQLAKPEGEE
jgi:hypothetical protein